MDGLNPVRNFTLCKHSRMAKQFESVHALNEFIEGYFKICDKNAKVPTLANLAVALGVSREDLLDYNGDPQVAAALAYAKTRIAAVYEERILDAPEGNRGDVFLLKTNHGYTERSLVENRHTGEVKTRVQFELPPKREERFLSASIIDVKAIEDGQ